MFVYTVMGTEIVGRKSAKTFEWRRVEEKEKKPKVHRQVSSSIEGREDTESVYSFAHGTIITVFPFSPFFCSPVSSTGKRSFSCLCLWSLNNRTISLQIKDASSSSSAVAVICWWCDSVWGEWKTTQKRKFYCCQVSVELGRQTTGFPLTHITLNRIEFRLKVIR